MADHSKYKNPVIYGDYSDPDVIRVGEDFYMVSSSFSNAPAIPILHSYDLINWKVVNYVCDRVPEFRYENPVHGSGVWAPSIRFHAGEYYVFFPMPDEGIYVSRAKDPRGKWSKPVNMLPEYGVIDPCPFWDEDGEAYLVTAVSGARVGYKSVLVLRRMAADGTRCLSEGEIIFDGNGTQYETIEGPKLYKKDGWYYIFAPAGGVKCGFQAVLRSRSIHGPYEARVVMRQGSSMVNGPHQGAWVDTGAGEDWFIHFQDVYAGGRIVHLQPMRWEKDGWPVIGEAAAGAECGEPVAEWAKPNTKLSGAKGADGKLYDKCMPDCSDEFDNESLGLQWQWNANPKDGWYELMPQASCIRLNAVKTSPLRPVSDYRNLLLQKWPAPEFSCVSCLRIDGLKAGDMVGVISLGQRFSALAVRRRADGYELVKISGRQEFDTRQAFTKSEESVSELAEDKLSAASYELKFGCEVRIVEYTDELDRVDALGQEQWVRHIPREEIRTWLEIAGDTVPGSEIRIRAQAGRWVGVKHGIFCAHIGEGEGGFVLADHVRYTSHWAEE